MGHQLHMNIHNSNASELYKAYICFSSCHVTQRVSMIVIERVAVVPSASTDYSGRCPASFKSSESLVMLIGKPQELRLGY